MSISYNQAYFDRFRHQNRLQKVFLPRIDRKEPLFSQLTSYFKNQKGKPKLLDIGCGSGLFLSYASNYFDCTGIDISKAAIKQAKRVVPQAECQVGSFKTLSSYPDEQFNVIALFDVLEHVTYHEDKLNQIYRILKPDGLLAFSAPNLNSIGIRLKGTSAYTFKDPTHLWHFSTNQWKHLFSHNGFIPYRTWHGGLIDPPYFKHIPSSIQTLLLKYPTQVASLFNVPIPSKLGEVVFMLLLKNPNFAGKAKKSKTYSD